MLMMEILFVLLMYVFLRNEYVSNSLYFHCLNNEKFVKNMLNGDSSMVNDTDDKYLFNIVHELECNENVVVFYYNH